MILFDENKLILRLKIKIHQNRNSEIFLLLQEFESTYFLLNKSENFAIAWKENGEEFQYLHLH